MVWTETTRKHYQRDELRYASDLKEREWEVIASLMPAPSPLGRPRKADLRAVVNAILYVLATGCQWRALPKDFPPRSTVQGYFYRWRDDQIWHWINDALVKLARRRLGRKCTASAGIIDSQSTPTTESGGPRGIDAGKRVKGRKRHIVTDTEGFLLAVLVHEANIQDPHGAVPLLRALRARFPRLDHIFCRPDLSRSAIARRHYRLWPLDDRNRRASIRCQRIPTSPKAMGGRANLRLARSLPPPRQGLRTNHRQRHRMAPPGQYPSSLSPSRKALKARISF